MKRAKRSAGRQALIRLVAVQEAQIAALEARVRAGEWVVSALIAGIPVDSVDPVTGEVVTMTRYYGA